MRIFVQPQCSMNYLIKKQLNCFDVFGKTQQPGGHQNKVKCNQQFVTLTFTQCCNNTLGKSKLLILFLSKQTTTCITCARLSPIQKSLSIKYNIARAPTCLGKQKNTRKIKGLQLGRLGYVARQVGRISHNDIIDRPHQLIFHIKNISKVSEITLL